MTLGAVPYTIIALAIFGCVFITFGLLVDQVLIIDNDMQSDTTLPYSQARGETMAMLAMCFKAMAVVALISAGIFLVMNGVQSQSGEI